MLLSLFQRSVRIGLVDHGPEINLTNAQAKCTATKLLPDPSLADYVAAEGLVERLKSAFAGYFQHYDVLLCAVLPLTASPPNQDEYVINGEMVATSHMTRHGAIQPEWTADWRLFGP
jgi:Asp-tRNA(Asn)/Glu-tRNA(Gln) amidotransferase A subunit family amidase